jgi:hypothetical protein
LEYLPSGIVRFGKEESMAKKSRRSNGRGNQRKSSAAPRAEFPSVAAQLSPATPEKIHAATQAFFKGILARGEAVPAGQPLPPGATHEIVGQDEEGNPILARRRYSLLGSKTTAPKKRSQSKRKKK